MEVTEVEAGDAGHEVTAVFRHFQRLASLRSEAIAQQAAKKAHNAPAATEAEAAPAVKKGKKHIKDTAKKELQQLLVFLEFVIGPLHNDEERLQAQYYELFHRHVVSSKCLLAPTEVQLVVEALQTYLDSCKALSSWQKKLGSYLLQHLLENRDDPDNSLVGLPVHRGILKGCYDEVGGLMHLCEDASVSSKRSSRRSLVRGALAVAFPSSSGEEHWASVIKVEGASKRRRRTRKTSSNALDASRDTLTVETAAKPKKRSQLLKGSWKSSLMKTKAAEEPSVGKKSDSKPPSKSHKRSKSGSWRKEDIEIVRSPSSSLEDSGGTDGEEREDGAISRPLSPFPVRETQQEDQIPSTEAEAKESESVAPGDEDGANIVITEANPSSDTTEEPATDTATQTKVIFVRVLRVQEGRITVATSPTWPQQAVELPSNRVLPLHSDIQKMLGNPRGMSQLVVNPLEEWYAESSSSLKKRMEALMEERGVDVERMKHTARQQEGDIKTFPFLLRCKETLESIVEQPPNDLLQDLNAQMKQEVLELVSSGTPCFLPTREGLVQYLQEVDYGQEAMRTVTANLQNVGTAIEQVALEKVRLLNGTRKDELSRWWLTQISTMCTTFLERLGFEEGALPENYIETAPHDIRAVRANLQLVKEVLDRKRDIHGTQELVSEVKELVYGRIDSFLKDTMLALAVELGQLANEPLTSEKARLCLEEKKDSFEEGHVKSLENNIKDVEYLCRMKQLEEEEQGGQLRLGDVVPVSGLVMSAFHRRENVLKTVIELWGSREPGEDSSRLRAPSVAERISATEVMEECSDAFEDIGGDFVMMKKASKGGDSQSPGVASVAPPSLPQTFPLGEAVGETVESKVSNQESASERGVAEGSEGEGSRREENGSEADDTQATTDAQAEAESEPERKKESEPESQKDIGAESEGEEDNRIGNRKSDDACEIEDKSASGESGKKTSEVATAPVVDNNSLDCATAEESGAKPQAQEPQTEVETDSADVASALGVEKETTTLSEDCASSECHTETLCAEEVPKKSSDENVTRTEAEESEREDRSHSGHEEASEESARDANPSPTPEEEDSAEKILTVALEDILCDDTIAADEGNARETLDEADRALAAAEAAVLVASSKEEAEAAIAALERAVEAAEVAVKQRKNSGTHGLAQEEESSYEEACDEALGTVGEEAGEDNPKLTVSTESVDTLVAVSHDVLSFADSLLPECGGGSPPPSEPTPQESIEAQLPARESLPTKAEANDAKAAGLPSDSELAIIEAELLECELEELELEEAALAAELALLADKD